MSECNFNRVLILSLGPLGVDPVIHSTNVYICICTFPMYPIACALAYASPYM